MPTPTSTIKFLKSVKYDCYMFSPVDISNSHTDQLPIKTYKGNQYIFLPKRKVVIKDSMVANTTYTVTIKDWIYRKQGKEYYCMKYYLSSDTIPITTHLKKISAGKLATPHTKQ